MASHIRASLIIRSIGGAWNRNLTIKSFKPTCYAYRAASSATTSTPPTTTDTTTNVLQQQPVTTQEFPNIRWDTDDMPVNKILDVLGPQEITGSIIPFTELNIMQKIFFPYQYPIMHYMDFLLNYMPWWFTIVATTATIRIAFFPLVLKLNKAGIKIFNLMPQTQKLQVKINEATLAGDAYGAAINKTKLNILYDQHGVSVKSRLMPTLIQTPAFLCLFFTLKNLATYYKIPSLATGGALWFTNLTIADPLYILPSVTSLSIFLLLEYGLEGSSGPLSTLGPVGRWVFRAMPVGLFFIFQSFPTAVLLFWTTNNLFTLFYAILFKQPWVKRKLNIPERLNHPPEDLPLTNQSFSSQFNKGIDRAKAQRTTLDLRRLDDIAFQKAGIGPIRKTHKTPPKLDDS